MTHKNKKRAFTLIEMLIVIVIIGILAAALIPRLSNARGRANDTARKADLRQVATAINASMIDKGVLPANVGALTGIAAALTGAGMNAVPKDPVGTNPNSGIPNSVVGQYAYTPVTKGGVTSGGYVLMAKTETEGGSNRVVTGTTVGNISGATNIETITPCTKLTQSGTVSNNAGDCGYADATNLRYIVTY